MSSGPSMASLRGGPLPLVGGTRAPSIPVAVDTNLGTKLLVPLPGDAKVSRLMGETMGTCLTMRAILPHAPARQPTSIACFCAPTAEIERRHEEQEPGHGRIRVNHLGTPYKLHHEDRLAGEVLAGRAGTGGEHGYSLCIGMLSMAKALPFLHRRLS